MQIVAQAHGAFEAPRARVVAETVGLRGNPKAYMNIVSDAEETPAHREQAVGADAASMFFVVEGPSEPRRDWIRCHIRRDL